MLAVLQTTFLPKEVSSGEQLIHFFTNRSLALERLPSDSLRSYRRASKIDVKTNGSLLRSVCFESVDSAEGPGPCLSGARRLFLVSHTGRSFCFWWRNQEKSSILADLRRNEQVRGTTSLPGLPPSATWFVDQDNVHFSEEFRNLVCHDLTHPEDFHPLDDNLVNSKITLRNRGQMVLHVESLWFWWYF